MDAASQTTWYVPDLHTLLMGLVALQLGTVLCRRIAVLGRLDIPAITLAGSFFVDLANALIVKAFLLLPMFR